MKFEQALNVWYLARDEKELRRLTRALHRLPITIGVTAQVHDIAAFLEEETVVVRPYIPTFSPQIYDEEGFTQLTHNKYSHATVILSANGTQDLAYGNDRIRFADELLAKNDDSTREWHPDKEWTTHVRQS